MYQPCALTWYDLVRSVRSVYCFHGMIKKINYLYMNPNIAICMIWFRQNQCLIRCVIMYEANYEATSRLPLFSPKCLAAT